MLKMLIIVSVLFFQGINAFALEPSFSEIITEGTGIETTIGVRVNSRSITYPQEGYMDVSKASEAHKACILGAESTLMQFNADIKSDLEIIRIEHVFGVSGRGISFDSQDQDSLIEGGRVHNLKTSITYINKVNAEETESVYETLPPLPAAISYLSYKLSSQSNCQWLVSELKLQL